MDEMDDHDYTGFTSPIIRSEISTWTRHDAMVRTGDYHYVNDRSMLQPVTAASVVSPLSDSDRPSTETEPETEMNADIDMSFSVDVGGIEGGAQASSPPQNDSVLFEQIVKADFFRPSFLMDEDVPPPTMTINGQSHQVEFVQLDAKGPAWSSWSKKWVNASVQSKEIEQADSTIWIMSKPRVVDDEASSKKALGEQSASATRSDLYTLSRCKADIQLVPELTYLKPRKGERAESPRRWTLNLSNISRDQDRSDICSDCLTKETLNSMAVTISDLPDELKVQTTLQSVPFYTYDVEGAVGQDLRMMMGQEGREDTLWRYYQKAKNGGEE
jgi:hypothetical protein